MKIVYPDYLKEFKCSAGECKDTCCAGWEVVVDPQSLKKYSNVTGEFGEKLRSKMTVDEDGDTIFLSDNGRCPFLNDKNLCDIYINCGENFLCNTCKMFPRFFDEFGSIRESGIGIGCPEAAKIILSQKSEWKFSSINIDEESTLDDIDEDLYNALQILRKKIFKILFDKSISFDCCLQNIIELTEACQNEIDVENFGNVKAICQRYIINKDLRTVPFGKKSLEILEKFEILSDIWYNIRQGLDFEAVVEYSDEFRNIAAYYIYRYLMKAVFDYDAITRIRACAFSCEVVSRVHASGVPLEDAVRIYSKEAEYSAENIETLYNFLY